MEESGPILLEAKGTGGRDINFGEAQGMVPVELCGLVCRVGEDGCRAQTLL